MPWLARLDARASHWPAPVRWSYLGLKWYLIVLGGGLLLGTYLDRLGLWSIY